MQKRRRRRVAKGPQVVIRAMAVPTHMGGQEDDPDDISNKVVKLLRDVARLKVAVHAASSRYVQIMDAIESNVSWSWGRGACKQRKLAAAQEQLKAALNEWHRAYVCTVDVGGTRKKYAAERAMVEVAHFLEAKLVIDKVASISTSMHRAHAETQQS